MLFFLFHLAVVLCRAESTSGLIPTFSDLDANRSRIAVSLEVWAKGFSEVTDIVFPPDDADHVYVLEKSGNLFHVSRLHPEKRAMVLHLDVSTASELGLLGLAFHPRFSQNRKIYLNYNPAQGSRRTVVSEWLLPADTHRPVAERVLLQVNQPYPNHNGGELLFGPDGMLYVGLGDGGLAGDPKNNGQKLGALLGKILRIDVDKTSGSKAYGIPRDNPFVLDKKAAPEVWALGLRNPWRYTFDPRGRLIVADVGQNRWEEVSIVEAGKNYGWKIKEASHCHTTEKACASKDLIDPWLEYGREDGGSITGGFVYQGKRIPALQGKYVFGDFVSGRIWAADLPGTFAQDKATQVFSALGKWPVAISTFGRDPEGELYVADFSSGTIYKITAPPSMSDPK